MTSTPQPPPPVQKDIAVPLLGSEEVAKAAEKEDAREQRRKDQRELVRSILAVVIIATVPAIILLAFVSEYTRSQTGATENGIKELAIGLMGPAVGVAGAVVGFYFGERRREN